MNNTVNNVLNWFVKSSANPEEVSATLKGVALLAGSHLIDNLSSVGINLSQATYTHDVAITAAVLGWILTILGGARKIVLTSQNSTPVANKG